MTGTAYRRSAELAGVVGPYDGYARNAEPHKRVMRKHAAANDEIRTVHPSPPRRAQGATNGSGDGILKIGEKNGWRNAQASVLAPTGTIGLMMDCDTTGIEPDLALVKFKKLVGGGSMQIVNQTVPRALRKLGYPEEQVEAIVEYIAEHGHVVDAPGLKPEHYAVFDCAMGERSIAPMGHVRMMAAAQPFLSGAISKTVNMPESATVEDVEDVYFQGWKLGLKALAIYRDNCKVGQPLSDAKAKKTPAAAETGTVAEKIVEKVIEYRPTRKRLPKKRPSQTMSFSVGGAEGYMTAAPTRTTASARSSSRWQAGLDPGRRDGRVLDRDLDRAAVRRAAGDLRREVHQHAVRAGRHDRRPGHPDGAVGDGLHLPPAGAGLPAVRRAGRAGHLHRRRAGPAARDGLLRAGRRSRWPRPSHSRVGRAGRRGRRRQAGRGGRREAGTGARPTPPPSCSRLITGTVGRRAALLHLRHQDAPRRLLLRLRGLRQHLRLQLSRFAADHQLKAPRPPGTSHFPRGP